MQNSPDSDLPDIPTFEVEPEESFEIDADVAQLIRRVAAARQMDPDAFLAILIDCDARGVPPLWKR
jgi:hypothetical protein